VSQVFTQQEPPAKPKLQAAQTESVQVLPTDTGVSDLTYEHANDFSVHRKKRPTAKFNKESSYEFQDDFKVKQQRQVSDCHSSAYEYQQDSKVYHAKPHKLASEPRQTVAKRNSKTTSRQTTPNVLHSISLCEDVFGVPEEVPALDRSEISGFYDYCQQLDALADIHRAGHSSSAASSQKHGPVSEDAGPVKRSSTSTSTSTITSKPSKKIGKRANLKAKLSKAAMKCFPDMTEHSKYNNPGMMQNNNLNKK